MFDHEGGGEGKNQLNQAQPGRQERGLQDRFQPTVAVEAANGQDQVKYYHCGTWYTQEVEASTGGGHQIPETVNVERCHQLIDKKLLSPPE